MRSIPFAFMNGVFDPAKRSLSVWNRGSFPGGGSAWTGVSSLGTSGSQVFTEITNYPDAGTALNGFAPADFNGTNDRLTGPAISTAFTTTAGSIAVLFKADTLSAPSTPSDPYNEHAIFSASDGGCNIGVSVSTSGVRGWAFNGTTYVISQYVPIIAGKWYVVALSWDATNLYFQINDWAPETISLGGANVAFGASPALKLGVDYSGTLFFDGQIEEVMCEQATWSRFTKNQIVAYMNKRYAQNFGNFVAMNYGTPVSDYNPANATASGGRVTLVTDPYFGYSAAPTTSGGGPALNSSNVLYGGKPTFDYTLGNVVEPDNLFAPSGLATSLSGVERTIIAVCHNGTGTSAARYLFNHENGERFGVFRNGSSAALKMNGPSNDVFSTIDCQTPAAFGMVFKSDGTGRFCKNGGTIGTLSGLGFASTITGGTVSIGNYNTINDIYTFEGSIARLIFFSGALSDATLQAAVRNAQGYHGL